MLRFVRTWWDVAKRTFALLWGFYASGDLLAGAVGLVAGASLNAWPKIIPWWGVLVGILLLVLYAVALAVYGKIKEVEDEKGELEKSLEKDPRRVALNDLLGVAHEQGERLYDLGDGNFSGWATSTYSLIMAAFGKSQAQIFLSGQDIGPQPPGSEREMYSYIQERLVGNPLRRLESLMTLETIQAERAKADQARRELVRDLFSLIQEGDSYAYGSYATSEAVDDWEARASGLIAMALGNEKRRNFQLKEPDLTEPYRRKNPEATEEQIRAMELLDRLKSLRFEANRFDPPPPNLHPDFDIGRYRKWLETR